MNKTSQLFWIQGILFQTFSFVLLLLAAAHMIKIPWISRFEGIDIAFYMFPDALGCISIGCWPLALGLLSTSQTRNRSALTKLAAWLIFIGLWMNSYVWVVISNSNVRFYGATAITIGVLIMLLLSLVTTKNARTNLGQVHILVGLMFLCIGGASMLRVAIGFNHQDSFGIQALTEQPIFASVFYLTGVLGIILGLFQQRYRLHSAFGLLSLSTYLVGSASFSIGYGLMGSDWTRAVDSYWLILGAASLLITLIINGLTLGIDMLRRWIHDSDLQSNTDGEGVAS